MQPFLTVIIPVYKIKEEYLRCCFDSILSQRTYDYCVIAVDDGSPDNCGAICDEYAKKDSRFKVIHQSNSGVSAARNNGIEQAQTEWVTFVDPDDWIENNYIEVLFDSQKKHPDVDIFFFFFFQEFSKKTIKKHLMDQSGSLNETWLHNIRIAPFSYLTVDGKPYEYETNTVWNKMYRRSMLVDNEMYFVLEARKGQDVIFNSECFQLSSKMYYIKQAMYHYRYLEESITNRFNPKVQYYNEIAFENYERIIKKFNLAECYWEAYYGRVLTRLYSCMRLFYFHDDNTMSKKEVYAELDKTLQSYPYCEALKKCKSEYLSKSQKIFVHYLKKRNYSMIRFLVKGRMLLKKMKGNRLSK